MIRRLQIMPSSARSDNSGVYGEGTRENVSGSTPIFSGTRKTLGLGKAHLCSTVAIPTTLNEQASCADAPSPTTYHNVIVGFDKLRQLLQPKHRYFKDKQAFILEFARYKETADYDRGYLYPRVKGQIGYSTRFNPYHKYKLARTHSGRTVGQVNGLVSCEDNGMDDLRMTALSWTMPQELSQALCKLGPKGRTIAWSAYKKLVKDDMPAILGISGELGSLNNLHVWKTKNPLDPHYHFHQVLMNYQLFGARSVDGKLDGGEFRKWFGRGIIKQIPSGNGKLISGSYAFSYIEVVQLKVAWVRRLKAMCRRNRIASKYFDDIKSMTDQEIASKIDVHISPSISWKNGENRARFINKVVYQKRHWIEDYAEYSNHNLDCDNPSEWLEKYENRSRPFGWWCQITYYGGTIEKNGERVSPVTAEPMIQDGIMTVYGLINDGNIGGMATRRGMPITWRLCQDDLKWLAGVSSASETLSKFSWRNKDDSAVNIEAA